MVEGCSTVGSLVGISSGFIGGWMLIGALTIIRKLLLWGFGASIEAGWFRVLWFRV